MDQSDSALLDRRLRDEPTRQSDARDSEQPQASHHDMCKVTALTNSFSFLSETGRVTVRGRWLKFERQIPTGKRSFENRS